MTDAPTIDDMLRVMRAGIDQGRKIAEERASERDDRMTPHAAQQAISAALPHAGPNATAAIIARVMIEKHGIGGARRFVDHITAHIERQTP